MSQLKPVTLVLLIIIWVAALLDLTWVWGVMFLIWSFTIIRSGDATLYEPITRDKNPGWFWVIAVTWVLLSVALLIPSWVLGG